MGLLGYDENIESGDEGFGPGTDLIVAILAILLVMLATLRITAISLYGEVDTSYLDESKRYFWHTVSDVCGKSFDPRETEHHATRSIDCKGYEFNVTGYGVYETFSFGSGVLFDVGQATLLKRGIELLTPVREFLTKSQNRLMEVQVAGHADTTGAPDANLDLGARRAQAVYYFLTAEDGLDPTKVLLSAQSYGQYRPTDRDPRSRYDDALLQHANSTSVLRSKNRRIEISVYFRLTNAGAIQ